MKTRRYQTPGALISIAFFLLFNACIARLAMSDDPHGYHARPTAHVAADPARGAAFVALHRRADLGHNVFVKLWIDGEQQAGFVTVIPYETYLTPGHHVLWMAASPNPKWMTPSETTLFVRRNRVYNYTVESDHSGLFDTERRVAPRATNENLSALSAFRQKALVQSPKRNDTFLPVAGKRCIWPGSVEALAFPRQPV